MSGSDPRLPDVVAREKPDLRLLPVVAGMWIGQATIVGTQPGHTFQWAAAGVALVLTSLVGGAIAAWRGRRSMRPATVVLVLVGAGLGVTIGSLHVARLHPPVLREVAAGSTVIQATVRIVGDPRRHEPADDGGRAGTPTWTAEGRVQAITVRGRSVRLRAPVVLRGQPVRELRYGSVVDLTGRADEALSPQTHALALQVLGAVRVRAPPGRIAQVTTTIRTAFAEACSELPVDAAALLMGLAVGDESLLRPELDDAMVLAGLSHLTAVSGSNTSLVCGIAMAILTALGVGWRGRVAGCLLVLAAYVELVRPQPSVLRAAAMGVVALVALSTGGRRRGAPALLVSALVLLVWLPQFAVSLGFALSFAATAGLLVVGPPLAERLADWPGTRRVPEPIRAALAVAMAAHLATLPLAVLMGNGASLVALPANVLVTPLVPVATVIGLVAAMTAPLAGPLAAVLAWIASPATAAIAWTAHTAAAVPHGVVPVAGGAAGAIPTTLTLAALAWSIHRGWRPWRDRRALAAIGVVLIAAGAIRAAADRRWPPEGWLVLACDVGQGDALLVRPPGSRDALLVDAGPDGDAIADCLTDAGVRRVVVLITHFHADHIDGLQAVLDGWPVDALLTTTVPEPQDGADRVTRLASAAGVASRQVRAGDRLAVLGLPLHALWPARRVAESPANNASVVCLVQVPSAAGPVRVLLTGDAEPEAQAAMMAQPSPAADVVKVPHHGSRYQNPGFARWSGARIALVSVGEGNDYGHPSAQALAAYRTMGALVGRTDQQGALAVVTTDLGPALLVQR